MSKGKSKKNGKRIQEKFLEEPFPLKYFFSISITSLKYNFNGKFIFSLRIYLLRHIESNPKHFRRSRHKLLRNHQIVIDTFSDSCSENLKA